MKSKFTLTKTIALAIMLVCFTAVSAASISDDSCKSKCCKNKKASTVAVTLTDLDKVLEELDAEIRYITAVAISKEVKNTLKAVRFRRVALAPVTPLMFFAFDVVVQNKVDAKDKIDFTALDKEMNQAQEELSKMDESLKNDDAKTRKAAEEILKTGIKS